MSGLRRSLGLLDATMVNVGVIVGSAVFLTASDVARALPHPLLQLGTWGVAALFSLAGALTIAEPKLALIAGLIVLAFTGGAGSSSNLISPMGPMGLAAFGPALIGPLFAFDGWITTSYIGGEVKQPTSSSLPGCSTRSGASPYSCSGGATISSVHTGSGVIQWCPPPSSPSRQSCSGPRWYPLRARRPSAADCC